MEECASAVLSGCVWEGGCVVVGRGERYVRDVVGGMMTCSDVDVGGAWTAPARFARALCCTSQTSGGTRPPEPLSSSEPSLLACVGTMGSGVSSALAEPPSSCSGEMLALAWYGSCNGPTSSARMDGRTVGNGYAAAQTRSTKNQIRCMTRAITRGLWRGGKLDRGWGKMRLVVRSC